MKERGNKLNFLDTHKYEYRKKRLRNSIKEQARKDNKSKNVRIRERKEKLVNETHAKKGRTR
jgi:hypothetical protein